MNIIIPATGIGKRFKEAGYKELKPFIKVNAKECILDFVINCFDKIQDKFYFIVRPEESYNFSEFATRRKLKAKIILFDGLKLGPSGTLIGVKDLLNDILNEPVIISYCDFGQKWNYENFLDFIEKNTEVDAIIPCYTGYHPHLEPVENVYAVCKTYDKSNIVYKVMEKYHSNDKFNEYHSSGIYYFKSLNVVLNAIKKQIDEKDMLNGEYYTSITNNYLDKVLCYPFVEKFYQFGTPNDFEYTRKKIQISRNLLNNETNIKNTVILSAGRGERFLNLNFSQPKPFLPLGQSAIINNIIEKLNKVHTNIICVGAQDHKKYWENLKIEVRYVKPNKIGPAYSYQESCEDLKGDVLILPCDLIAKHIDQKFENLKNKYDAIIFVTQPSGYNYKNPNYFTWITGKEGLVEIVSVKHRLDSSNFIMIGSFYFRDNLLLLKYIKRIFNENVNTNGEFFIDNVFELLMKEYKVGYFVIKNYFSFGTPDEYLENSYWFNN
ncbi:NTP transferase domain-containing protein [Campylobacter sp. RM10543]|uniref:sugar phosphate nucleotidyltransferase n=1 Tax=Campylobacter molothri TaxID=1032242 RepID=UPI00301D61CC|nr:NTP transferase domain-containing protein [Campylobacter sp. RM10543]